GALGSAAKANALRAIKANVINTTFVTASVSLFPYNGLRSGAWMRGNGSASGGGGGGHHFFVDGESGAGAFFPGESRCALQAEPFHPAAQFRVEKNIFHGPGDFFDPMRVEQQPGAVGDFRHGGGVRTGDG